MTGSVAWLNGPVGLGADSRVLRQGYRTVLVVVPFMVAGIRLMDVLALLEADHRLVVMFTVAPTPNGAVCHGAEEFVRAQGGLLLPWQQAVQCEFDLVLAASDTAVEQLHGKVMLLPHGAGALPSRLRARSAGSAALPTHGLDRNTLVHRGRLVPAALPLTHVDELTVLRESCPEAEPVAVVAGDVCFDRLVASLPMRNRYRRAFGLEPDQKLVVVTTSWQPESALGSHPDLLERLLSELPPEEYRVAAVLHPNIWGVNGAWTVQAWFADCLRAGLILLPPQEGWRAALAACDVIVGDHGSVTSYGAAVGAPIMLTPSRCAGFIRPGSLADMVSREAVSLRMDRPLERQLRQAAGRHCWERRNRITRLITSEPGRAAGILRRTMYRLLDIEEPDRPLRNAAVPLPDPVGARNDLPLEEAG
ncbi:hypothetical protein [Streptomyces marispadix]|uniref:Uncharacterized protein n=1 Tax=Streptomyces marispadix TaxID=2922868 RepID=A0ABS9SZJ1_9ACTN|nr:hypothetical protein [Streptomyces marispadix]MCH6161679.1 hypothetical protein [Streptomyces marispadix]